MPSRPHQQPIAGRLATLHIRVDVAALIDMGDNRAMGRARLGRFRQREVFGPHEQIDRRRPRCVSQRPARHFYPRYPDRNDGGGTVHPSAGARFLVLATKPDTEVVRPPIALDPVLTKQCFMSAIGAPRYVPTMFGGGRLEHD